MITKIGRIQGTFDTTSRHCPHDTQKQEAKIVLRGEVASLEGRVRRLLLQAVSDDQIRKSLLRKLNRVLLKGASPVDTFRSFPELREIAEKLIEKYAVFCTVFQEESDRKEKFIESLSSFL